MGVWLTCFNSVISCHNSSAAFKPHRRRKQQLWAKKKKKARNCTHGWNTAVMQLKTTRQKRLTHMFEAFLWHKAKQWKRYYAWKRCLPSGKLSEARVQVSNLISEHLQCYAELIWFAMYLMMVAYGFYIAHLKKHWSGFTFLKKSFFSLHVIQFNSRYL